MPENESGRAVGRLRKALGLSQAQLAARLSASDGGPLGDQADNDRVPQRWCSLRDAGVRVAVAVAVAVQLPVVASTWLEPSGIPAMPTWSAANLAAPLGPARAVNPVQVPLVLRVSV